MATAKDCGLHEQHGCDCNCNWPKINIKKISTTVSVSIAVSFSIALTLRFVLTPTTPKFICQDTTLYNLNLTSPTQLDSIFQVTIHARNPNTRAGICYDRLLTYAFYQNQQITLPTSIPPTYQDTKGTAVWSVYFQGPSVPIAPDLGLEIKENLAMGSVPIVIKMVGRVRFKVGMFVSGSHRINVNCHVLIPIGNPNSGVYVSNNVVKYTLVKSCDVSV